MKKIGEWFAKRGQAATDKTKKIVAFEATKQFTNDTREIAATMLNPSKAIAEARIEKFTEAVKRLGVTEDDLKNNYKNFAWLCWISLSFAVFSLSIGIFFTFHASLLQGVAMVSIAAFSLANAFKFSYRAFQIRHQKLCGVKPWLQRSKEWLPNPFV
jgi:intracellular multiplication protein IcmV